MQSGQLENWKILARANAWLTAAQKAHPCSAEIRSSRCGVVGVWCPTVCGQLPTQEHAKLSRIRSVKLAKWHGSQR